MPLPGTVLKIVDPETGAVLPRGSSGEICIKGATLMLAYIGKTAQQSFDEQGFFRTGDGGHVDEDGCLFWQGRITEIIKTGGANVSPVEIDQTLVLYPGVRRAQTVGLPHDTLGEMIVSCIVPHDGVTLDAAAITTFVKARLASYKVPKQILFFREDELDITGSGKVKVLQLRELVSGRL
jgi:acyl-CoA synthetase (AMP-forming)/AMP-acid ligase II